MIFHSVIYLLLECIIINGKELKYIYIILITWVRVWYGKIFDEQANLFSRAKVEWKIKPGSEISSHMTPTRVISGLFHTRSLHWRGFFW